MRQKLGVSNAHQLTELLSVMRANQGVLLVVLYVQVEYIHGLECDGAAVCKVWRARRQ